MYNKIVAAPGVELELGGPEGGVLLLGPPGQAAGQLTLEDLQNRTWHLLREDGPDTGYPAPTTGDFPIQVVTRDLNIALGQFISQTGLAPKVSERMDTFPVFPVLDYPVPPGCAAISRIEYTPAGGQTYKLIGKSFEDFDTFTGDIVSTTSGNPYYYRQMYAGYIRLQPQPTIGNAVGPGIGSFSFSGAPSPGDHILVTLTNPPQAPIVVGPYIVLSTDTLTSITANVANLINSSGAVQGVTAFLSPAQIASTQVSLTAINAPGTQITFEVDVTGTTVVSPTGTNALQPNGDTITFYYTSLGTVMINKGDTPGIPPQFQMAICYRVLMDYWRVKQDFNQAKEYERMYKEHVREARGLEWDAERSTQPTIAGTNDDFDGVGYLG